MEIDKIKNEIMPIGKYKGMSIEEIFFIDKSYIEWISTQDWFKNKFDKTYNLIINIFNPEKNECTPEHNKLQFLFLNDDIKIDIVNKIKNNSKLKDLIVKTGDRDVWGNFIPNQSKTIKDIAELQLFISDTGFEINGFDVIFTAEYEFKQINIDEIIKNFEYNVPVDSFVFKIPNFEYTSFRIKDNIIFFDSMWEYDVTFFIEIKPSIGDDFPNVLRQIKKNKKMNDKMTYRDKTVLAYKDFAVSNLTFEQVEQFFNNEKIYLYKIEI